MLSLDDLSPDFEVSLELVTCQGAPVAIWHHEAQLSTTDSRKIPAKFTEAITPEQSLP
jgi:hypothetical protein